jgi:F-type H+-transporting ATPase subunit alpha
VLLALTAELFDRVPLDRMTDAEHAVQEATVNIPAEVRKRLDTAEKLSDEDRETIIQVARKSLARFQPKEGSRSGPESVQNTKEKPKSESKTEPETGPKHETGSD